MSVCGPVCTPPSAQLLFFPGSVGPAGPQGPAGPASTVPGPAGAQGAIGVYTGDYVPGRTYYDTAIRQDIVSYGGFFWRVANPGKSGGSSWGVPGGSDDWTNIGNTLFNVATGWKLLSSQEIPVGVNVVSPGFLKSNNFVDGTSGWLATGAGGFVSYDAIINGLTSTDTAKFNLDSPTRTMPAVSTAQIDIPTIPDADIPADPAYENATDDEMIFFGWLSGTNTFVEHRFGNTSQKFLVSIQGTGTQTAATSIGYILPFYRLRDSGGAWGSWVAASGQITYMQTGTEPQSFLNVTTLTLTLSGTQDIQFSAGFSKSASANFDMDACTLSAIAYN